MDVTVCVATYGDRWWRDLADTRAVPSTRALGVPCRRAHSTTLHGARNAALAMVTSEFVCFLDADDELEPGFFDRIAESGADLRAPSVRYVTNATDDSAAAMPMVAGHDHACTDACLVEGNWLVIGTVAPTQLLRDVDGFHDFPVYEDWDLWLRCWRAGATIEAVPDAVYRAYVRHDSRNRGTPRIVKEEAHRAIAEANGLASVV